MTLEEYLEANCHVLEQAVKIVPAGGDLPPFFGYVKDGVADGGGVGRLFDDKAQAVAAFKSFLRAVGAEQYAIIGAAWYVRVSREESPAAIKQIDREGTGGAYQDRRRECYQVVVGDRERTLMALFAVERDDKRKIRGLIRQEGVSKGMFGRMVDLLVDEVMQ
jgi:hypothetical protein